MYRAGDAAQLAATDEYNFLVITTIMTSYDVTTMTGALIVTMTDLRKLYLKHPTKQ